ncbi:MAG: peptidylprolyl isomerase [SAR202 cluster bacterium]|nr:peptidylprolyl isomerase [SAR202 cluster bacterium]
MTIDQSKNYSATIRTNHGDMTVELFAKETPQTVNNFVFLARDGFYDGGRFHRIIKGFMIQGGCPKGDGTGNPGYRFADEPVTRSYVKGTLAMANAGPDTNGCQFFIVHGDKVNLPPRYTIFGQLAKGMDVLDAIAATPVTPTPRGEPSRPTQRLEITTVEVSES